MSDQTIQVKYVGTAQRWPELAITGRQSTWMPGQIESRAPSEATALFATGLFSSPPVTPAVPYATNLMSFIPSAETRDEIIAGTSAADCTDFLNAAFAATPEGGKLIIPSGRYNIAGTAALVDKNINIECLGVLVIDSGPTARLKFQNTVESSVSGTTFESLPKKDDVVLTFTTLPPLSLESANYFVTLKSTEEEITRIGQTYYTPYTKNESLDITDAWKLRSPVKLEYTDAAALTIDFFKKRVPVTVSGLRVEFVGPPVSIKYSRVLLSGISNVTFKNCLFNSTQLNVPGEAVVITSCSHLTFIESYCIGPNSSDDDSYAFFASTSSFLSFYRSGFSNIWGTGNEKLERGYAGRHNSDIVFSECAFNGVDDHYGHNYYIENMSFNAKGVSISGGSVTLRNCTSTNNGTLFKNRSDTPYSDGLLHLDGCNAIGAYRLLDLSVVTDPSTRTTKAKFFDDVLITNTSIKNTKARSSLYFNMPLTGVIFTKTRTLTVDKMRFAKLTPEPACSLHADGPSTTAENWVNRAVFKDINFEVIATIDGGTWAETGAVGLRSFHADVIDVDNFNNWSSYTNKYSSTITVRNSIVGPATGSESIHSAGRHVYINCEVHGTMTASDIATIEWVGNTFYKNNFGTSSPSALSTQTSYMRGNKAVPSVVLTHAPNLDSYINPAHYKTV